MTNRLAALLEEPPASPLGDYWVLRGAFGWVLLSPAAAVEVERQLARRWPPRWLTVRDLVGSRVRVRTALVHCLLEATVAQRAEERRLERARQAEERGDARPWEDTT
ncbi:hypothetical protein [Roseisolibacter sp. H3M3-2]|uniref:hypothetical protein n=1 Tax=Roseisolibacter sp. H3M3-2 TaxID=3031323 RepID=UPI0023D9DEED|nr:hypothetical protein [Roseisolibacter sp. H3M3-2]MDF1504339.1 hypothetical protein [Roseisolibacter sp. H3M3-2]